MIIAITENELRDLLIYAIGYNPVPLSIRNHPEIKSEYRTTADRDGIIERIMHEINLIRQDK